MAPPKPRARRARGNVSWLPSGAARVTVYGGIDQLTVRSSRGEIDH